MGCATIESEEKRREVLTRSLRRMMILIQERNHELREGLMLLIMIQTTLGSGREVGREATSLLAER